MIICSRIFPVLLLSEGSCYQSKSFSKHDYLGDMLNLCRIFSNKTVDELVIFDISNKPIDFKLLAEISSSIFMPLTYGGNIQTLRDAEKLFNLGIEKICLKSLFFDHQEIVTEIVNHFGSQSVSLCLDYLVKSEKIIVLEKGSKKISQKSFEGILKCAQNLGVGEIILQNVLRDGGMEGYDFTALEIAHKHFKSPICVVGGCASLNDMSDAFAKGASAAGAGTLFSYVGPLMGKLPNYPTESEKFELLKDLQL